MVSLPAYSVLMPLAPWEPVNQVIAALESLKRQTLAATQVVVSCDGPPPASLRAVLSGVDLPLTIVEGPGGEGVGPVLTRGLHRCTEALVVRADADDLSLPERCATQVAAMTARPDLVALSTPLLEFIESPEFPCALRDVPVGAAALWRRSRWRNPINHPAVILRRQQVLALGGYHDCPGFEDYDLWLRLLHQGAQLDNLKQPLVLARVGADHLARRRGRSYAVRELNFLLACAGKGILGWPQVALLIGLRTPIRLAPAAWQQWITARFLRLRATRADRVFGKDR
jgi:hypothetical protein